MAQTEISEELLKAAYYKWLRVSNKKDTVQSAQEFAKEICEIATGEK
jgi:hypothetical protein